MSSLFDPLQAGALALQNRVFMAPLTRARAGDSRLPNGLMAEYYAQRAGAGLIISEATAISPEGYGWKDAPGGYTPEQMAGWRAVTEAVHKAGGKIALQLWHMGRVSHPLLLNGNLPVAPSAIAAEGANRSVGTGPEANYVTPRAMTRDDITRTVADYAAAARRAVDAGFDGVEIHGANGYLINQFLVESANARDDEYGGTQANRLRFLREVVEAVGAAIGFDRTGLRLSAINGYNSMVDSDLHGLYTGAARMLNEYGLSFLHVREPSRDAGGAFTIPPVTAAMREVYDGVLVVNDGYDGDSANKVIADGLADAVAFGRPFISNPDLVERLRTGAKLNEIEMKTLYAGGREGYTDYPSLKEKAA